MLVLEEHLVPELAATERLSDYGIGLFRNLPSRKSVKKAIKKDLILIDGVVGTSGRMVQPGMLIQLIEKEEPALKPFPLSMPVLFEDGDLAIIRKPAGISVSGNYYRCVQNALPSFLKPSTKEGALKIPRPAHRLDALTAGLLVVAKTSSALMHLGRQFEERTVYKKYQAIVVGETLPNGTIQEKVDGKEAETLFETVESIPSLKFGHLALLDLFPKTGRTHQLRIHLSQSGWPIVGDPLYQHPESPPHKKGLFLAAVALELRHPTSGELLSVEIDSPQKFRSLLDREKRRWMKYNS